MCKKTLFFNFLTILITVVTSTLFAQPPIGSTLKSPYHTVHTHLHYLKPSVNKPKVAARTIKKNDSLSLEKREELVIQLKEIFIGKGLEVDEDLLSHNNNYIDSISGKKQYVLFPNHLPQVYLEKVGKYWYYSDKTVQAIPKLHKQIYWLGIAKVTDTFPKFLKYKFLSIAIWQYILLGCTLLICFILHRTFTIVFNKGIKKIAETRLGQIYFKADAILAVASALSWLVITQILILSLPEIHLPLRMVKYLILALVVLATVFSIIVGLRIIDLIAVYLQRIVEKTESTFDDHILPLARKGLQVLVILVGLVNILQLMGINLVGLLAGLSLGGLAVALAAQDTIKNLFGSLMIFIDRPFRIGDRIVFDNISGQVEEVGFRSTRIRTRDNSLIYIPNGKLADMIVDNLGIRSYRRFKTIIGVTYDTPPELIEQFIDAIGKMVEAHPNTLNGYHQIYLNDFDGSSLNIYFNIYFEVETWPEELKARHQIMLGLVKLANTLGVQYAFPTQTVHVENFPSKPSLSPVYENDTSVNQEKVNAFLKDYKKGLE